MRLRQLGNSDLHVSEISLGSWLTYGGGVGDAQARACVDAAFDAGINFIDTANVYALGAAESFLGDVLAPRPRDRQAAIARDGVQPGPQVRVGAQLRAMLGQAQKSLLQQIFG